jgi:hypothetical protein
VLQGHKVQQEVLDHKVPPELREQLGQLELRAHRVLLDSKELLELPVQLVLKEQLVLKGLLEQQVLLVYKVYRVFKEDKVPLVARELLELLDYKV